MNECDNPEHDWITIYDRDLRGRYRKGREIRWCNTCHTPIKQYHGEDAVKMMDKIAEDLA